jgi:hypothetical protein
MGIDRAFFEKDVILIYKLVVSNKYKFSFFPF